MEKGSGFFGGGRRVGRGAQCRDVFEDAFDVCVLGEVRDQVLDRLGVALEERLERGVVEGVDVAVGEGDDVVGAQLLSDAGIALFLDPE